MIGARIDVGSLVVVTWRDAWFAPDSADSWPDEYLCQTAGWLVSRDELWIRVASEQTPDGDRAVTHIPTGLVHSIVALRCPNQQQI